MIFIFCISIAKTTEELLHAQELKKLEELAKLEDKPKET